MTSSLEILEEKKKKTVTKGLLRVMSECYRAGVCLRNFAYDIGFPKSKLNVPVISVGNVVAGGTGKTPLVQYLAQSLYPKKVVILSRGYKRKSKKTVFVKEDTSFEECGDEPLLLAKKLPESTVVVHPNRAFAGHIAQLYDPDIFLLDDGMQHRQLHRDYEVVSMDAENLFGAGYFLPRGFLRDSPKRLATADCIFLNGVRDEEHYKQLEPKIRIYTKAPIVCMQRIIENKTELASKKVVSFCAIAAPYRFQNTLKTLGCDIVMKAEKPDHDPFQVEELERLANLGKQKGAACLVCTEKDAVKLPPDLVLQLPIIAVRMALKPFIGKEHLETFIKEVTA